MKHIKTVHQPLPPTFVPFEITFLVETDEEAQMVYNICNHTHIIRACTSEEDTILIVIRQAIQNAYPKCVTGFAKFAINLRNRMKQG